LASKNNLQHIRSYFSKNKRILYLKKGLSEAQENFLLARELGFQYLGLVERPNETTVINIDSFEKFDGRKKTGERYS